MTPLDFWRASLGYVRSQERRSEEMAVHVVNLLNLQGKYLRREMTLRTYLGREPKWVGVGADGSRRLSGMTDGEKQKWLEERKTARKQRDIEAAANATETKPGPEETK